VVSHERELKMNSETEKRQMSREDALPIVLVHGTVGRSEDWSQVVDELSKSRTVIRPNYGERISRDAQRNGPAMSDFVAGVMAEVRDAGVPRFDLFGASLGAAVATCVAAEYPEMVNSLVLQSGFCLGSDPRMKLQFDLWLRLARTDRVALTKLILASGFSCEFLSAFDEPTLEGIIGSFVASSDWQQIEQAIDVDLSVDVRKQAQMIEVATLVITAKHDQIVPPTYSKDLTALIPHAHEVEINAGHLTFLEKPQDLASAILSFCHAPQER
jgi:3-oxoadipate enol-lactonase